MEFSYGIDDRPRPASLLIFGLQWLAVSVPPLVLITGRVVAGLEAGGSAVPYLQRLFLLVALVLLAQVYLGHRLPPLVLGPATVLLVGILASSMQGFRPSMRRWRSAGSSSPDLRRPASSDTSDASSRPG